MSEQRVIDPVTRIEGHAKITIHLNDEGQVSEARFHVTEFRGFERFCVGRPFWEMPGLTARICGICPVSHLLASARAGDAILAVEPPPAAHKLRRLMNLGQIIQSHSLSVFHLSGPDLFLGFDSDPVKRNLFGLIEADREFARGGIRLRQFGQDVIDRLGGRKIHPAWAVPGGVRHVPSGEVIDELRGRLPEVRSIIEDGLTRFKRTLDGFRDEIETFGHFPSLFMALVTPEGDWEHYKGDLRIIDASGTVIEPRLDPSRFRQTIGEAVEEWSYLKSPYYKPIGYPEGMYRVGPLARLNVCERINTPGADAELTEYRQRLGRIVHRSFFYHYARLIEILGAIEHTGRLLDDPELTTGRCRAEAGANVSEAIGITEAPRGTLFHHYQIDDDGLLTWVNLIIATGQNNLAMNRAVTQIAQHFVKGREIPEGVLNRIEAGIRAFDPCLSCSTHAVGQMPLRVQLIDANGEMIHERTRA